MKNSKKLVNLISLVVLVATNILSPLSYVTAEEEDIINEDNAVTYLDEGEAQNDGGEINDNPESESMTDQQGNNEQDENEVESGLSGEDGGETNDNPESESMTDQQGNNEQDENEVETGLSGEETTQNDEQESSDLEDMPKMGGDKATPIDILDMQTLDFEKNGELQVQDIDTSIITYGEETYTVSTPLEGNGGDTMNNFTYGTITIPRAGHDDIIIMDRNLGADSRWDITKADWNYNDYPRQSSYGYQYQRGNNYGFAPTVTPTTSGSPVARGVDGYSSSTWITTNPWNSDASTSDVWTQGPCPAGWHVPSSDEWNNVYTALDAGSNGKGMAEALLLPPAGYRHYNYASVYDVGSVGSYWSSTPDSTDYVYGFGFRSSDIYPQDSNYRADGFAVRCFRNSPITITFNLNGGYWTEEGESSTGNKTKTFFEEAEGSLTDRKTPSKQPTGQTGWMFDGWYLENGARWTGNMTSDMTVYAHWLPFEDLVVIADDGTKITVMDRNLGATAAGTGCSTSDLSTCGYHFQWGNNYGFKPCTSSSCTTFPNGEITGDTARDAGDYAASTYYGSKFRLIIWSSVYNPNLWGGSGDTKTVNGAGTEVDRQGPCPDGYHVPSTKEWNDIYTALGLSSNAASVTTLMTKFKLPFVGDRNYLSASTSLQDGYYWSSSFGGSDHAYYLRFASTYISPQEFLPRANGFSVRCFKNAPQLFTVTFNPNGGEVEGESSLTMDNEGKVTLPGATREPNENGERVFEGWFASTGVSEKIGNSGDVITLDADKTVYAHWAQTITIFDLKNPLVGFTVLDRNLGAVSSGIDDVDSYGFYYQWGDNHGHLSGEEMTSSEARLEYKSEYDGHGYDGEEKRHINIGGYPDIWENNNSYPNLWGGGSDSLNESNGFVYGFSTGTYSVNNVTYRQGPCPDGYHVPSYGERAGILNLYYESINQTGLLSNYGTIDVSVSDGDKNFINALHLPYAGHTWSSFSTVSDDAGLMGYYWTSTPASNTYESLAKKINKSSGSVDHDRNSRAYGYSVRCFKDEYVAPTPQSIEITYDPNGGAFSGKSVNETTVVTYTKNASGTYEPDINIQFPNKAMEGETGYMFAGWYTSATDQTSATEWLGYVDSSTQSQTVYAKWLPFEDLDLDFGNTTYTIMDRNLGATGVAEGLYKGDNNNNPEDLTKIGKYYQWGNNYGFRNGVNGDTLTNYDDSDELVKNTTDRAWGPGNYYSSATFIKRSTSPYRWDDADNANLWGGSSSNVSDKQGPCPAGYHIPSNTEWQNIYNAFTTWKSTTEGTAFCKSLPTNNVSRCFAAKLKLPFAGIRDPSDSNVMVQGDYGRYWSSTRNDGNYAYSLYFNMSYVYPQYDYYVRAYGLSVRCLKNSPNPKTFTLSFDAETNGGITTATSVTANQGTVISLSTSTYSASKDGYTFVGWNTSSSAHTALSSITLNADTTVYAIFKKNLTATFTIQDINAATQEGGTTSCTLWNLDESCNITSPTLNTKNGYSVLGWNTNSGATGSSLNSNTSISISSNVTYYSITRSNDKILHITYTKGKGVEEIGKTSDSCTLTGTYNGAPQATSCTVTAPSITPKSGYENEIWTESGTNHTVQELETITLTEDLHLTASAEYEASSTAHAYDIIYNLNGEGIITGQKDTYTVEDTFTLVEPTRTGYEFIGWTGSNGNIPQTGVVILSGTTGDLTFYANWTCAEGYIAKGDACVKSVVVSFDVDGGTSKNDVEIEKGTKLINNLGTKYSHTSNISDAGERNGYYSNSSSTTDTITIPGADSLSVELRYGTESNYDYVNVYRGTTTSTSSFIKKYTGGSSPTIVNFDVEGDSVTFQFVSDSSVNEYYGYYAIVWGGTDNLGENPTKDGYTFAGWYTEDGQLFDVENTYVDDDMTLYAHWTLNTYTVNFDSNNGTSIDPQLIQHGGTIDTASIPSLTHTKATFLGWTTDPDGTHNFDPSTPITADITLYAQWICNTGYVTLQGDGGPDRNCFVYGTKKIETDGLKIVIMDRNLGARTAWDGVEWIDNSANMETANDYYGYYYQWGNNWGFSSKTTVGQAGAVTVDDSLKPSKYSNSVWSTAYYQYPNERNLWGDETDTDEARKGPCPTNWHVPSNDEWRNIVTKMGIEDESLFAKEFLLPASGKRDKSDLSFSDIGSSSILWTSQSKSTQNAFTIYLDNAESFGLDYEDEEDGMWINVSNHNFMRGLPVRCLMNNPKTITFELNGGTGVSEIDVPSGTKATSPANPTRTGYTFTGWYTEPQGGEKFDFEATNITENMTLYAHWESLCPDGKEYAETDGQCYPSRAIIRDPVSGEIIQINDMEWDDLELYFLGDDETNVPHYTIMDRNMGATEPYNQNYNNQNNKSYGNHYYWGDNKYFFYPDDFSTPRYRDPGTWIEGEQGPCPDGYHVPSPTEWNDIYDIWNNLNLLNSNKGKIWSIDLLLPFADYIYPYDFTSPIHGGYYLSSTNGVILHFDMNNISPQKEGYSNLTLSLRCFKNSASMKNLTLHANGGTGAVIAFTGTAGNGNFTALGTPSRANSIFTGWYDAETGGNKIEKGSTVVQDLYARFDCNSGYIDLMDGNGCIKNEAMFLQGTDFNRKVKELAHGSYLSYADDETSITKFLRSDTLGDNYITVSVAGFVPIYVWFDNGILYYYSQADKIYLNPNCSSMFRKMKNLNEIDLEGLDTSRTIYLDDMFAETNISTIDLSRFDTSNLRQMSYMFNNCKNLQSVNMDNFDISNVSVYNGSKSYGLFYGCNNLKNISMRNLKLPIDFGNVAFQWGLDNIPLENFDTTNWDFSKTTTTEWMFREMRSLKSIIGMNTRKNMSNITGMGKMFYNMENLEEIDLSAFDTTNVTNMYSMFAGCGKLKTLDLTTFNTKKVTNIGYMFENMTGLETIYVGDNFELTGSWILTHNDIFKDVVHLVGGNGTNYDSTKINKTYAKIDNENQTGYFTDPRHFAVRFKDLSGNEIATQWISTGGTATQLSKSHASYAYYTSPDKSTSYDFSTKLYAYSEVYAEMICDSGYTEVDGECVQQYTVEFEAYINGGLVNMSGNLVSSGTIKVASGTEINLSDYIAVNDPTGVMGTGWIFDGWGTIPERQFKITSPTIVITGDITLHALFYKIYESYFYLQDINAGTLSSNTGYCTGYNGETSCDLIIPTFTENDGYTFDGFSYSQGNTGTVEFYYIGDTYYTVTHETAPVSITFNVNGNLGDTETRECYKYNGDDTCLIRSPDITPAYGFTKIGWSTGSTLRDSSWTEDTIKSVSGTATYYAQSKKEKIKLNISYFTGVGVLSISSTGDYCDIDEVYNGASQATGCTVIAPDITLKTGYGTGIWTKNTNPSIVVNPGNAITITSDNDAYTASATPNTHTLYTVHYYLENVDNENYTLDSTDDNYGTTDDVVSVDELKKGITGAHFEKAAIVVNTQGPEHGATDEVDSITIDGNGDTEVYLFYKRNVHTVSATAGEGVGSVIGTGGYKYGQTVTLTPQDINPCYTANPITFTMPDNDVQVTLSGTIKTFTVALQKDEHIATVSGADTYDCGAEVTITATPSTRYEFNAWMSGSTQISTQSSYTFTLTGDVTYRATSRAMDGTKFTVKYWIKDINANTYTKYSEEEKSGETDSVITLANYAVSVPCGTYVNGSEDGGVDGVGTPVTTTTISANEDTVINLFYDRNSYTVTTSADSGIQSVNISAPYQDNKYECGAEVTLSATPKTGYHFTSYSSEDVDSSTSNPYIFTMPDKAVSIQAQSNANTYTVKFNANGGRGTMSSQTFIYDVAQELSDNLFTKSGYIFTGWSSDSGATVPTYTNKQSVSNLATTGSVTLYAVWTTQGTSTKYTVRHIKQGLNTPADDVVETEELYAETNSEQTPAVNTYEGFNSPSTGTLIVTPNGDASIDYIYTRKDITIIFDMDNLGENPSISGKYDTTITKPGNPSKSGYTFVEWLPAIPDTFPATNETYVAQYTLDTYTITYHMNSGTNHVDNPTSYTYLSGAITLKSPTREGYVFNGWTGTNINGMSKNVTIPTNSEGNREYTAVWGEDKNNNGIDDATEPKYTVKYTDGVAGEEIFADEITNNLLSGFATPTFNGSTGRANYIFAGWNPAVRSIVTGNQTYTATWYEDFNGNNINDATEPHFTVRFLSGEHGDLSGKLTYDNILSGLTLNDFGYVEPTKIPSENYMFSGWNMEINPSEKITIDLTYTSIWGEDFNHNGENDESEPKYKITVNYNYISGSKASETVSGEYLSGIRYSFASPTIQYYTADVAELSGITTSTQTYNVIYRPVNDTNKNNIADEQETKYKVTVNYVYSRGGTATGSVSGMYLSGVVFSFVSPTIRYYTPNSGTVTGTGKEEAQTFTVTYTPNTDTNGNGVADEEELHYVLTIHYVNGSGGKVYDDYSGSYLSGANYSITSPLRTYYTIQTGGEVISGVMGTGNIERTVVYLANNDTNGNGIADEEEVKPSPSGGGGGSSGGGGGGGGKRMPTVDEHGSADNEPTSGTIADEPTTGSDKSEDISDGQHGSSITYEGATEMEQAYNFSYKNGITTVGSFEKAKMYGNLTRIQMAKMLSYFAINVLGQKPNTTRNIKFNDVSDKLNAQYNNAVTLSYQLGIMGINMKNNNFRPYDEVTRAEFATALSRMLYHIEDGKGNTKYYEPHIAKLYKEGIITKTDPKMKERRGYVMLMLMRSAK